MVRQLNGIALAMLVPLALFSGYAEAQEPGRTVTFVPGDRNAWSLVEANSMRALCQLPCRVTTPIAPLELRSASGDRVAVKWPDMPGPLVGRVRGEVGSSTWGYVLLAVGGTTAAVAGGLALSRTCPKSEVSGQCPVSKESVLRSDGAWIATGIVGLAGLLTMGAGGLLLYFSRDARLDFSEAKSAKAPGLRVTTWGPGWLAGAF